MVFGHYVADAVGGFLVGFIGGVAHFVHAEKHTAVNRLKAIAHIGERARNNHRH